MLSIAIEGLTPTIVDAVAARLRGAMVRVAAESAAILLLGDPPAPRSVVECHLRDGKNVVITPGPALTSQLLDDPRLRVVNPDRYLPSRQLIRQQLDAGKLGDPGLLRLHCWQPAARDATAALLRNLDLACWYFGKPPDLVYAVGASALQIHLGFPGGGMALLDLVHDLPATDAYHALSLIGSHGAAYADDHANMQILYRREAVEAIHAGEGIAAWTALVQHYVDGGADASSWRDVLRVADVVRESLASKQAVALKGGV
ncbi:MAG TPA: hypothetical protein VFE62_21700 [Gemmataceae bacterium]|nr:hypothetical protein [Gemmataceae bacterium]